MTTTLQIDGFELYSVATDYVTADLIIWNRYRQPSPGVVEAMLDLNPHLAVLHQTSPFLPVGTLVRVPISYSLLAGKIPPNPNSNLWTDKNAYSN